MPEDFHPRFAATGIGSLPHTDPREAVADVLARLPEMPYWPQLPARGPAEDMNLQYAPALEPLLAPDYQGRRVVAFAGGEREAALAAFYERLFSGELEGFGLAPEMAAGLAAFLEAAAGSDCRWVKGQVTGPFTLASAVSGPDGKALLFDEEAAQALAQGLGAAAAAQAKQLAVLGKPVVIFFDEPGLAGYGSAFTPASRELVVGLLSAAFGEARGRAELIVGVHVCANTDWSLIVEAGADILNLDSFGYGDNLLLYPEAVSELMGRGGAVAWGAVPTQQWQGSETAAELWAGLERLLAGLEEKGLARELIASQSLVTPSCGMGSLDPPRSRAILEATRQVSELARRHYG